jgi:hypothetical protein
MHVAFKIPYTYRCITELCKEEIIPKTIKIEMYVIMDTEKPSMYKEYKRHELGGGQA